MNNPQALQDDSLPQVPLEELIRRFREAEDALHSFLNGQVDAVLDPVTATPIMLHETQKSLVDSESRYRRLLSRNLIVVFELEADGTTLFVNEAVVNMLGYTPADLIGRNWWDVLLPGLQHHQMVELYTRFEGDDVTRHELDVTTRQGSLLVLELSWVIRRNLDRSLFRILGLAVDITERRKAELETGEYHAVLEREGAEREAELTSANATLRNLANLSQRLLQIEQAALAESEHANQMKLQFLSMITHELRTPLASIKGFATTLLADDVSWDAETQHQFIATIDQEADNMIELIEQLLDASRLQAGTLFVQTEPQQLRDIVDKSNTQLQTLAAQHRLVINVPPDLPLIMADAARIAAVLVNLVGNAVKFSPPGTQIKISAAQFENSLQVDVSDQGSGIAPEVREKMFDTFWQPEQRTHQHTKGAGLGLAICKGIVEAHGGRIWVADVSVGTTVSFTLPLAPSEADN